MAIRSGFFNSINGDRKYKASRFAEYFASFIGSGVFPNPSTNLQVMANDDMTVTVKPGQGWINGYIVINDDDYILQLDPADGVLNRIDRIVARYDVVDREIRLEVKKGTFASTPVAPALQRDADAYELGIADIYVGKGAISITQANITDLRLNTNLCGIVHGVVDQVDTTTLFDQYLSWYQQRQAEYEANLVNWTTDKQNQYDTWTANKKAEYQNWYDTTTNNAEQDIGTIKQDFQASFDAWFATVQGALDGDTAGNLLNMINANTDSIDDLAGDGRTTETVKGNADDLDAHLADDVSQGELHGFRLTDGKLEYFDGLEWQRVRGDGYPVGNISNFNAKSDDKQITLAWQDPDDVTITDSNDNVITIARWKGTKVLRKTGSYPQNENDGVLVVDNGIRNQYLENGFTDTGLQNDVEYFYMAFPYTEEDVYTVDESNRMSAIPTEIKIYGIEIDGSNSNPETSVVYTDDAVGFNPAMGNNGAFTWGSWESIIKDEFEIRPVVLENLGSGNATVNYELQYDDYTKKADGSNSNLTGIDGDVMIEFGIPLWWKFTRIDNKLKIQLSTKEFDGAIKPAFEVEDGYNQVPIYPLFLTQIIYLLMFKSLDSQTALGRGYVDGNSNYLNTGVSNDRPFIYGENTGKQQMKFLGLEDYWGNRRWWIDGCFYDSGRNMLIGKNSFNNTGSGYENFGQASSADLAGYIDKVQGGNNTGFIPASTGGSATASYCDYGNLDDGGLPSFGGYQSNSDNAGGFSLHSHTATNATAVIGGRLFYSNGNDKIYIGAYLGANQSSKLRSISGQTSHNNATIEAFRTLAKANN